MAYRAPAYCVTVFISHVNKVRGVPVFGTVSGVCSEAPVGSPGQSPEWGPGGKSPPPPNPRKCKSRVKMKSSYNDKL